MSPETFPSLPSVPPTPDTADRRMTSEEMQQMAKNPRASKIFHDVGSQIERENQKKKINLSPQPIQKESGFLISVLRERRGLKRFKKELEGDRDPEVLLAIIKAYGLRIPKNYSGKELLTIVDRMIEENIALREQVKHHLIRGEQTLREAAQTAKAMRGAETAPEPPTASGERLVEGQDTSGERVVSGEKGAAEINEEEPIFIDDTDDTKAA